MKACGRIIGLPVISAQDGSEVGTVKELLIDVCKRAVRFLIVDDGWWYFGANIVAMDDVLGIGDDAVVITSSDAVKKLAEVEEAVRLVKSGPPILRQTAITQKGMSIGTISEYFVDENTGRLMGCRLEQRSGVEDGEGADFIPDSDVVTYGAKTVVVKLQYKNDAMDTEPLSGQKAGEQIASAKTPPSSGNVFIERQKKFLIGRRATKSILDENNDVLVKEGSILDEDMIERVFRAGKLVELTMNSRP